MATASSALRNSQADDLVSELDQLEVLDGSQNVLVTFSLSWNAASSGQTDVSGLPKTSSASNGGTASEARLVDSGSETSEELTGLSVGTSGTEVIIGNTSITAGQDVELQTLDYTAPSDPVA
jgi:hypothetical protein